MGTLISNDYAVADALEWVEYLDRMVRECRRLIAEGRVPDTEALEGFLEDSLLVQRQVKRDAAAALARGETTTRSTVSLSSEEHQRLTSMRESILNLLEILEIRKAVVVGRTEGVGRAVAAIVGGTFTP